MRYLSIRITIITATALLVVFLILPFIQIADYRTWYHNHWLEMATLIVLTATLVAVAVNAIDNRERARLQSQARVDFRLSQEAPVNLPSLTTATLFTVSNPLGGALEGFVKLKLWIGHKRIDYSGGGLYDGSEKWVLPEGSWRGVVEPGTSFNSTLNKIGHDVYSFLAIEDDNLPEEYNGVTRPERIRARLFVRYTDPIQGIEKDWESVMYYLQLTTPSLESIPPPPILHRPGTPPPPPPPPPKLPIQWIVDYQHGRYPPDGLQFDD